MAVVPPSPPISQFPAAMSSRRIPLSANPNAANSPLRNSALKNKRTLAQLQREEPYGQPPPAKKLVVDATTQRVVRSQSQQQPRVPKGGQIPPQPRRAAGNAGDQKLAREKAIARQQQEPAAVTEYTEKDIEDIQVWKNHHRTRFPKSFFYFDQIPSDASSRLKRQIAALGGHVTAFFSVDVTHVITSRSIPTEDAATQENDRGLAAEKEAGQPEHDPEQTETINPSLLTRSSTTNTKRTLFGNDLRMRAQRAPPQLNDQTLRVPKKAVDILIRARDMKKKIWTVDKLFRMTALLLETDPYRSAEMAYGRRKYPTTTQTETRGDEDRNLLRLLQKERVNGPSDRDPTVLARELIYFKGPYIYVYDIEEKQKPIMVKQYVKIPGQPEEKWPQFQTAAMGRCPFIEDSELREAREAREARKAKEAQQKARAKADAREIRSETKPDLQAPKMAPPKPVTGKRTLGEMERQSSLTSVDFPSFSRKMGLGGEGMDFSRKAFTSQAAAGRLLGGEPVASGVQPSNITSAIRSQIVSSTATTPGVITGLSKEVHGLQRQVLKLNSPALSQDRSSRQTPGISVREDSSTKRPPTLGRTSSHKLEQVREGAKDGETIEASRTTKRTAPRKKPRDRDLKPGYCENCAEKYSDFDEHIESEKHRGFANDDENWVELDDLLAQLERVPKRQTFKPTGPWSHSSEPRLF